MDYNSALRSILFTTLVCWSCGPQLESDSRHLSKDAIVINVDTSSINDSTDISAFIADLEIIPLKEHKDDFIGEVWKVILARDYVIVFDRYITKRIHVYKKNGELFKSIVPEGDGPNQFLQISDCWINERGNLEVYDFQLNRVIVFDHNFQPKRSFKGSNHLFFNSVQNIGGKYVGFGGYNDYNGSVRGKYYKVAVMDTNFKIQKTVFHFDKKLRGALISTPINPFGKIEEKTIFYQDYDPNIYNVNTSGDFDLRYRLNYTPNPIPDDFDGQVVTKHLSLFKSAQIDFENIDEIYKGYSGFWGPWFEANDFVVFNSFDVSYNRFSSIYDKKGKKIIAQGRFLFDNKNKFTIPYFHTVDPQNNSFIAVIEGYIIFNHIEKGSTYFDQVEDWEDENFYLIKVTLN
jgi:hypothetical protein